MITKFLRQHAMRAYLNPSQRQKDAMVSKTNGFYQIPRDLTKSHDINQKPREQRAPPPGYRAEC